MLILKAVSLIYNIWYYLSISRVNDIESKWTLTKTTLLELLYRWSLNEAPNIPQTFSLKQIHI